MGHVCEQVSLDFVTHLGRQRYRPQSGRIQQACPRLFLPTGPRGAASVPGLTDLSHAGIVNEAGIGTGASYDDFRPEKASSQGQLVIVNEAGLGLDRQTES